MPTLRRPRSAVGCPCPGGGADDETPRYRQLHRQGDACSLAPVLPAEVRETVRLHLAGEIDQWFVERNQSGVVFLMNVTDPAEARALLE